MIVNIIRDARSELLITFELQNNHKKSSFIVLGKQVYDQSQPGSYLIKVSDVDSKILAHHFYAFYIDCLSEVSERIL
jgi:hypothetical protein